MYEISIHRVFSAAHAILLYDGSIEPLHGHNWTLEITVASKQLDGIEVVMDFHELEKIVDGLIDRVNNRNLNEIEPFVSEGGGTSGGGGLKLNPTAERVAWWFGTQIAKALPDHVNLVSVCVGEAPGCVATYRP